MRHDNLLGNDPQTRPEWVALYKSIVNIDFFKNKAARRVESVNGLKLLSLSHNRYFF